MAPHVFIGVNDFLYQIIFFIVLDRPVCVSWCGKQVHLDTIAALLQKCTYMCETASIVEDICRDI